MRAYLIRRLLQIIPVFFGIMIITFIIIELSPGDPSGNFINPRMRPEDRLAITAQFGLDGPVYERFFRWVGSMLQGDFGRSFQTRQPVTLMFREMLPPTILLGSLSLLVALLIGVPAGIYSATKQYSIGDNLLTFLTLIGISMPAFFFALILIRIFSVELGWFPMFGIQDPLFDPPNFVSAAVHRLWHMVLPVTVLGLAQTASFMRYTRSSMLEVIKSDYIRTARAKGVREKVVIYRHAFRNAMIPVVTLLGFSIPGLISGAIMTETIFSLPGVGRLVVQAVGWRDYPIILANVTIFAIVTLLSMLLADILYAAVDPRVKYE